MLTPLLVSAGWLMVCCDAPAPRVEPALVFSERPTNVLVLSLDTLRPELLGRYTGTDDTPVLDALLAGGVVLEDHQSCSDWTFAAMVCAQAGARGVDLGFAPVRNNQSFTRLPDDVPLVSEHLSERGYQTAVVTSNSNFSPDVGLVRGFDEIRHLSGAAATWVTEETLQAADALDPTRPWYLHAHYLDPHTPYNPPEEFIGELEGEIDFDLNLRDGYRALSAHWYDLPADEQSLVLSHLRERYLAEYRYMDRQIGVLLEALESRGMLDDTLVIVFSDHGEQFWEHGAFGHGNSLHGEELAALAAFSAPGLPPATWDGPTRIEDIWPTAFEALGLPIPAGFDGVTAGLRGDDALRRSLRVHKDGVSQSAESDGLKLMYWWTGDWELYQVNADAAERAPLDDAIAQHLPGLQAAIREEAARLDLMIPERSPVLDEARLP